MVADAIARELDRKGQVYYVSNRVRSIDDAVKRVREAAGEARIGVAHGKMSKEELEIVMEDFSAGQKKKVLLAASLCRPAHLYVWDEPLNFVDLHTRLQITSLLRQAQPTMLFVEHDRAFQEEIATQKISL